MLSSASVALLILLFPSAASQCPPDELMQPLCTSDFSICERSCAHPEKESCPRCGDCVCAPGLIRNATGGCIPASFCDSDGLTACQRHILRMYTYGLPTVQAFVPVCDNNGDYLPMQCDGGMCWCVERTTGARVDATLVKEGEGQPFCKDGPCQFTMDSFPKYCFKLVASYRNMEFCKWRHYRNICQMTCCLQSNEFKTT